LPEIDKQLPKMLRGSVSFPKASCDLAIAGVSTPA
jgi:hypothetical protein